MNISPLQDVVSISKLAGIVAADSRCLLLLLFFLFKDLFHVSGSTRSIDPHGMRPGQSDLHFVFILHWAFACAQPFLGYPPPEGCSTGPGNGVELNGGGAVWTD